MGNDPATGWYPGPSGERELRYWDGNAWTTRTASRIDDAAATSNQTVQAVEPALTLHPLPATGPAFDAGPHRGKKDRSLHRSTSNRWLAGVAGGLGESFGLPPILVRVGFFALSIGLAVTLVGIHGWFAYIPTLIYLGLIAAPPGRIAATETKPESTSGQVAQSQLSRRAVVGFGVMCAATALAVLAVFAFWVPFGGLAFLIALLFGPLALWLTVSGLGEINRSEGMLVGRYFVGLALVLAFVGAMAMNLFVIAAAFSNQ